MTINQFKLLLNIEAYLTGLGAIFHNMVYALPLPCDHLGYTITQPEMLNIMVGQKKLGTRLAEYVH